jgi:hypothetical protein
MPRTILGLINRNRRFNHELSLYERGKIVGAVSQGTSFISCVTEYPGFVRFPNPDISLGIL